MVIMVPAAGVIDALKSGAAAGARSATVFSAGFGEGFNTEAAALGRELAEVIAETGLAVSGPNCMGNVCSKSRLVTLTEDRPLTVRPGPVALVGQSGGMMIYSNQALMERGIAPGYLITSGNEAGLSLADYIAFFAGEPEIKVIIIYIEAITDVTKFKAACRLARAAGKSVVAIKLGQSEAGRNAALAHTGSLAGSIEAFDAVAGEAGVIRADTLDDAVEITELLVHTGAPTGRRLGAVTLSGAFRGMLLDAAERYGLEFHPLDAGDHRAAERGADGRLAGRAIRSTAASACSAVPTTTWPRSTPCMTIPTSTWCIVQEGPPRARGRRPQRALHPARQRLRRHQGHQADRVHVADHHRPHRLQPRRARQGAAHLVPAGGLQGTARCRHGGAPRRASSGSPAARPPKRRRPPRSSGPSSSACAAARRPNRSRSTRPNRRTCCAPTASRHRPRRW